VRGLLRTGRRALRSNRRVWQAARFAALALFNQRVLIFRPNRREWGTPADLGIRYENEPLRAGPHAIRAWWMPRDGARVAVILFPGRAANISHELDAIDYLGKLGASVLAVDYPGYGASEGTATEQGCHDAALAAWEAVLGKGFAAENVILYGRSLGAAIAAWLAARVRCRALVFHGCASSMIDLGASFLPRWLVVRCCRTPLDSTATVAQCRGRVVVVHARDDRLVPLALARRVFDAAPAPRRMIEIPGDHFDTDWLRHAELRAEWERLIAGAER
jgi:pimeloyl-ACP methyl ester carboxylesterase